MLTVDQYRAQVLKGIEPLAPIEVPLIDSVGCVLAEDVRAPWPLPSFDNSSMDGYAIQARDVAGASPASPVRLRVIDDVPAGYRASEAVQPGTAVRIMTGAPIPDGADAIVPVELTDGSTDIVSVSDSVPVGACIRRAGADVMAGTVVVRQGTELTSRQVAVLAAVGQAEVRVHPRPRVIVISTGSELVEPGTPLTKGLITDSNSYMLVSAVQEAGAIAYRVGPIVDDDAAFMEAIEGQLHRADLIVTSGGVSMGAYDTVKAVLSTLGTVEFTKVLMHPGMPQGHGHVGERGTPIITLPGNPVSSYVSFEVYVRPVIRALRGLAEVERPIMHAACLTGFDSPANKTQFMRGRLTGYEYATVEPVGIAGSHAIGGLAQANCLIVVPTDQGRVQAGERVQVIDLRHG
ncbi:MAG: molybdopterin molybdotransferase MoeA [Actinomycetales bacterium]|nr:molybdopterin molybdotransferase MoeA [Actinomycetales bacterium]